MFKISLPFIALAMTVSLAGCNTAPQDPDQPPTLTRFDTDKDHRIGGYQHKRYHEKRRQAYEEYQRNLAAEKDQIKNDDDTSQE